MNSPPQESHLEEEMYLIFTLRTNKIVLYYHQCVNSYSTPSTLYLLYILTLTVAPFYR